MKLLLVSDAWLPQPNGVVTTLVELVRELQHLGQQVQVIHPGQFRTRRCPGTAGLDLALFPGRAMGRMIDAAQADAIHIATEGPLGWAARNHCLRHRRTFTTAVHTPFPELLNAELGMPVAWGCALQRRFHRPSHAVLVPSLGLLNQLTQHGLENLRLWTQGVDTRLFAPVSEPRGCALLGALPHPVSLFVGRLSADKNLRAFLDLDVPGSKVVCGVGPLEAELRQRYPDVHWLGWLTRPDLARVYAAADVFVFPCRHESAGRAMLEAMACGVPVAAFPVDVPLQVVGQSTAGALHGELAQAWLAALRLPRESARARALGFGWAEAARHFLGHMAVQPQPRAWSRQAFQERFRALETVTETSSHG